ncbi:hypothetical protein ACO0K3_08890 [Undibacterium sp. Rencai35W]|uniref:hypothetical protein n=1 Tax=Undibacterium sp. Rencai35W TaxID=3413046 RepID=UPI003BF20681
MSDEQRTSRQHPLDVAKLIRMLNFSDYAILGLVRNKPKLSEKNKALQNVYIAAKLNGTLETRGKYTLRMGYSAASKMINAGLFIYISWSARSQKRTVYKAIQRSADGA